MDMREFREAGHRVVDRLADLLEKVEDRPLLTEVDPGLLRRMFDEPLPREGRPIGDVLAEIEEKLLPYCTHVNHPGYFGLITPSPLPAGILGDLIASALNQNVGTWSVGPSAITMERQTVRWLTDLAGLGPAAGGNLTSGGMMANFLGVKLARDWASGDRAQYEGLGGSAAGSGSDSRVAEGGTGGVGTSRGGDKTGAGGGVGTGSIWTAYTSEERHVSVDKAADAVGIGREKLRIIPTDDQFRIRLDLLEEAIAADRRAGLRPMCVIAMGGSTNTGAVDPLQDLRRIADRERMWLHVDAAYGGGMLLSHKFPGRLQGLDQADSVTIDPHKWFYAPLDAGAILVRDEDRLTRSFGLRPPYLTDERDREGDRYHYYVHGFEQSRRFRSLKVWMSFKRYGADEIGRWVDGNVEQALRFHELASAHPDFEPAVAPTMSAICIRYSPPGLDEARLAKLHADVARAVERGGRFWISTTFLKGKTYFRVNPVNFRTRREHLEELFALLVKECAAHRAAPGS